MKLKREFYNRDTVEVAKDLLGKILVHSVGGKTTSGKIVEVEAYKGIIDKAAHTYNGRRTERVEVMYGKPGLSYVFFIYGMHYCMNVVTREEGIGEAVLIRALQPVDGIKIMSERRYKVPFEELKEKQVINLTNGPSKLCKAMDIDKRGCNGIDLCEDILFIKEGHKEPFDIGISKRIGIDYAGEAKDFPWRFFIEGNKFVSKIR
ncbi:DNA-3-methyladenine glycosylase [Clostridium pasteurianum]|uniref:Putative 3-methyladenine DNA glycosylase n=1 Tax=Clostridium pasteurianum BC1 TaxID=86416 RepID=R4K7H1_CLOPA|nr:DNA-3-methyladenine glycosylase [Clostridium pasteurianum]AGK99127.1 DNA-3-methyladenine glycosylase [Clostridium pasteurianum BC1]